MAVRRLWYLVALLSCWVFYIAYGEWFSWLLLLLVLLLPWFSLVLSLPAIWQFSLSPAGPDAFPMGETGQLYLLGSCKLPMPPFRGRIRLTNCIDGERFLYAPEQGLSGIHCGGFIAKVEKARVSDYLGLFAFPVRKTQQKTVLIRPLPQKAELPQALHAVCGWQPKFGGGFSENHELRLYRPGDSLNQVHWKLSAKTGKLILRQSMEPRRGLLLLTMTLRGTAEQRDRKFGRLLWVGQFLLEKDLPFTLRVLTGKGLLSFPIQHPSQLQKAVDTLLTTPESQDGSIRDRTFSAVWQYHIGGNCHEV